MLRVVRAWWVRPGARAAALAGAAFVCAWGLMLTSLCEKLDFQLHDAQARALAPDIDFSDLLLVDVTEDSIRDLTRQLGPWPYERGIYAKLTDFLGNAGAKSITYDIVFSEKRVGDEALAAAIARTPVVALAAAGNSTSGEFVPEAPEYLPRIAWKQADSAPALDAHYFMAPSEFLVWADRQIASVGVITTNPDSDGILRRLHLLHRAQGKTLPSLSVATLFAGQTPEVRYDKRAQMMQIGNYRWPVDETGAVLLRFPRNLKQPTLSGAIKGYHFSDVYRVAIGLDATPALTNEIRKAVKGKRVFVGSSAWTFGDFRQTMFNRVDGLVLLAIFDALLERSEVMTPPKRHWDWLLLAVALIVPLWVFRKARRPLHYGIGLIAAPAIIVAVSSLLFVNKQASALLFPLLTGLLAFTALFAARLLALYHERQQFYYEKLAVEEAAKLKSQFISHMTHELRTPLAAIMGFNRLLGDGEHGDRHHAQYVKVIDKNSQHLMTLINNMLDQSKIEAGQMKINRAPAKIREVVEDVVATLSKMAAEKHLQLTSFCRDNVPATLDIDAFRLRQVLLNLIGNAVKFTAQGKINVNVDWVDDQLKIVVMDTGPGMSKEVQERIFQPFRQGADNTHVSYGGTGLGLAISRNLCTLMGGSLEVESKVGEGSVFFVSVAAPRCADVELNAAAPPAPTPRHLDGRVLLADDNSDIRELLTRVLSKLGVKVNAVADGKQAVEAAAHMMPDLILMDIEMPVMDGLSAVDELRTQGYNGPILAMTAHPEGPEVEEALRRGFDDYLEKPINRERLAALLARFLTPSTSEPPIAATDKI